MTQQPDPARLRDLSDGFRVATDALVLAADHGCSDALYAALWALVDREAKAMQPRRQKDERAA